MKTFAEVSCFKNEAFETNQSSTESPGQVTMQQNHSVSEALRNLEAKGYHLADPHNDHPEEGAQPNDWRLDSIQKVQEEGKNSLLIAVSSASRKLKLVFLEPTFSPTDFSPVTLLRKLFPNKSK